MASIDLTEWVTMSSSRVTEEVMAEGSWTVHLDGGRFPTNRWDDLTEFGYIVITPQWVENRQFTDAALLGISRYTGIMLKKTLTRSRAVVLNGRGLHWLLGNETGYRMSSGTKVFTAADLYQVLADSVAQTGLWVGTVTEPGGTYTRDHYQPFGVETLRAACVALGAEYRINPDGTVDAGPAGDVFNITAPTVIVMRDGWGNDPKWKHVPIDDIESTRDATNWVSAAYAISENGDGIQTEEDSATRSSPYTTLTGGVLNRTYKSSLGIGTGISPASVADTELAQRDVSNSSSVGTDFAEIVNGALGVGDAFYIYDPPAMTDPTNPIWFRGEAIFPATTRLLTADWTLQEGMGVYFLIPDAAAPPEL